MNDRELLRKAAKAVGYWSVAFNCPDKLPANWDPLQNDGDALRLAVALKMNVFHAAQSAYAMPSDDDGEYEVQVRYVDAQGDPCAATRRAIVQTAAALA